MALSIPRQTSEWLSECNAIEVAKPVISCLLDYQAHVYEMIYSNLDPSTMASNNEQQDILLVSVLRKDQPISAKKFLQKPTSFCRNQPLSAETDLFLAKPASFCRQSGRYVNYGFRH